MVHCHGTHNTERDTRPYAVTTCGILWREIPKRATGQSPTVTAEAVLRPGAALLGEWSPVLQRRYVVLLVICINASLEVRLKALRRHGLRHRQREDQQCYDGQVPHSLIIGRRVLLPQC